MNFIGSNIHYDDCMIVALHNAAVGAGKKITYKKIYNMSLKNGWYVPGQGFLCKYLDDAFSALKLQVKLLNNISTKEIFENVVTGKNIYFFFRPNEWSSIPGHAMVATKGEVGVKVHNAYTTGTGWKTLSKSIRSGERHFIIEVTR